MRTLLPAMLATLVVAGASCGQKKPAHPLSTKCLSTGRLDAGDRTPAKLAPVEDECIAAAIAEHAFLEHVHHFESKYSVWPMDHKTSEWYFMIVGETNGLPELGKHWMIEVNRATGATEVTDGM